MECILDHLGVQHPEKTKFRVDLSWRDMRRINSVPSIPSPKSSITTKSGFRAGKSRANQPALLPPRQDIIGRFFSITPVIISQPTAGARLLRQSAFEAEAIIWGFCLVSQGKVEQHFFTKAPHIRDILQD
jgi:hypothetical protein